MSKLLQNYSMTLHQRKGASLAASSLTVAFIYAGFGLAIIFTRQMLSVRPAPFPDMA
jgi:hypothetical protein